VVDFGAFVKFSLLGENAKEERKLEGLVHISELAWQLIEDPRTIVRSGDKVKAKIIGIDGDKISLSIRALQEDPWSQIKEKYKVGEIVSGTVSKINHFGAFVYLDKDIHGLAHISEMSEAFPGKTLNELIKADGKYNWKILSIEPEDHRMGLVLTDKKETVEKNEAEEEKAEKKSAKIRKGKKEKEEEQIETKEKAETDEKKKGKIKEEKPAKKEKKKETSVKKTSAKKTGAKK
jgi:ribosomal protein S1